MPTEYKEPILWKHKKSYPRPYFSHWERDVFYKVVETIPHGAECKLTVQWNDPIDVDAEAEKILKQTNKILNKKPSIFRRIFVKEKKKP